MIFVISVVINFLIFFQHPDGEDEADAVGHDDDTPEAIGAEEKGQQIDRNELQNKRPRDGEESGDSSVVQRREESGPEDVEAHEQEGDRVNPEGMDR